MLGTPHIRMIRLMLYTEPYAPEGEGGGGNVTLARAAARQSSAAGSSWSNANSSSSPTSSASSGHELSFDAALRLHRARLGCEASWGAPQRGATHVYVILSEAKDLQLAEAAHRCRRERPKGVSVTARAAGASARAASIAAGRARLRRQVRGTLLARGNALP